MAKAKLRFREREVSRVIRAATKAGLAVGRVVIDHDGSIIVVASGETADDVRSLSDQTTGAAA